MLRNKVLVILFLILGFKASSFADQDFIYNAQGRRNPFIPLVTSDGRLVKLDREEDKGSTDLLVDGIIYDKQGLSYAIVNAEVLGVGDFAGAYRILKIESDKVVFLKEDQIREVSITEEGT
ncbi:MAG: hypothetical protein NTZ63_04780 [Candidatus Omnitrophica bacterium]|nr:hypothetical protein [Candidatus Omnitrophota bacterium]